MSNTTQGNNTIFIYPEARLWIRVTFIIFLLGIHLVGVPGNAIAAIIYGRKSPKSACDWLIFIMSINDAVACILAPAFFLKTEVRFYNLENGNIMCNLEHWFQFTTMTASGAILVIIAVDRYVKICHPHIHSLTPSRARDLGLICIVISAAVCVFPFVYRFERTTCYIAHFNTPEPIKTYALIVFSVFVISFFIVTFAYANVCKKLRYKSKLKQRLRENTGLPSQLVNAQKIDKTRSSNCNIWRQYTRLKWCGDRRETSDVHVPNKKGETGCKILNGETEYKTLKGEPECKTLKGEPECKTLKGETGCKVCYFSKRSDNLADKKVKRRREQENGQSFNSGGSGGATCPNIRPSYKHVRVNIDTSYLNEPGTCLFQENVTMIGNTPCSISSIDCDKATYQRVLSLHQKNGFCYTHQQRQHPLCRRPIQAGATISNQIKLAQNCFSQQNEENALNQNKLIHNCCFNKQLNESGQEVRDLRTQNNTLMAELTNKNTIQYVCNTVSSLGYVTSQVQKRSTGAQISKSNNNIFDRAKSCPQITSGNLMQENAVEFCLCQRGCEGCGSVCASCRKNKSRLQQIASSIQGLTRGVVLHVREPQIRKSFSCPDMIIGGDVRSISLSRSLSEKGLARSLAEISLSRSLTETGLSRSLSEKGLAHIITEISNRLGQQDICTHTKDILNFAQRNCKHNCFKVNAIFNTRTALPYNSRLQDVPSASNLCNSEIADNEKEDSLKQCSDKYNSMNKNEPSLAGNLPNARLCIFVPDCVLDLNDRELSTRKRNDTCPWNWPQSPCTKRHGIWYLESAFTRSASQFDFKVVQSRSSSLLEICDSLPSSSREVSPSQANICTNNLSQKNNFKTTKNINICSRSRSTFDFRKSQISKTDFLAPPSCVRGNAMKQEIYITSDASAKLATSANPLHVRSHSVTGCSGEDSVTAYGDATTEMSSLFRCEEKDARDIGNSIMPISRRKSRSIGKRLTHERKMTLMLVTVTAVFLLSWLPAWLIWLVWFYTPWDKFSNLGSLYLSRISLVNCAASPVIYFNFNPSYRSKVNELFRPIFRYFLCWKK